MVEMDFHSEGKTAEELPCIGHGDDLVGWTL